MPAPNLVNRMLDYFDRQLAWTQASLDALAAPFDENRIDAMLLEQQQRDKEYEDFWREYRGLLAEWKAASDLAEEERRLVTARSQEVQALNKALAERYAEQAALFEKEKAKRGESLAALRRGKRQMGKYYTGFPNEPGFIDRQS